MRYNNALADYKGVGAVTIFVMRNPSLEDWNRILGEMFQRLDRLSGASRAPEGFYVLGYGEGGKQIERFVEHGTVAKITLADSGVWTSCSFPYDRSNMIVLRPGTIESQVVIEIQGV